jgi:PPM family protein phosphatase
MLLEGANSMENGRNGADEEAEDRTVPAAITDTGCERDLNEDRYAVIESPSGLAWLVCDGMGGVAGGELAAQLAIDGIRRDLENLPARPAVAALKSAVLEANRIIVLRRQNQAFAQMGTTIVSALFNGSEVALGHVGDSRAYLVRSGQIQQLTIDHTYVQELVDKGHIKAEEALSHPQAHILTRAIGSEPGLEVDVQRFWVWPAENGDAHDLLVLCTDGLYSHLSDDEIAQTVTECIPQRACVKLVELAKSRGGYDNITLAVIPVGGQIRQEPPPGYDENAAFRPSRAGLRATDDNPRRGFFKTFWVILMLSFLMALLVVMAMMVSLSK